MRRLLKIVLIVLVVLLPAPAGCALVFVGVLGGTSGASAAECQPATGSTPIQPTNYRRTNKVNITVAGTLIDDEQLNNARVITALGISRGFSQRDIVIAIMTGLQESKLHNLSGGDATSVGMFQQQKWYGTQAQRMNPVYSTTKFYDGMATIHNRENIPMVEVAIMVQRPSRAAYFSPQNYFPGWETTATQILSTLLASPGIVTDDKGSRQDQSTLDTLNCTAIEGSGGKFDGKGDVEIAAGANLPGRDITPDTMQYLRTMASVYGHKIVVTTGTNHSYLTVNGNVSDHSTGHAADIGMIANRGGDDSPVGDAIAASCLIVAGDAPKVAVQEARAGGLFNRTHNGYRIQCIWKTYEGGNHHNHVHFGIKYVGG